MLRRKQEFHLQLQQIADAALLGLAFWGAHALRYYGTLWFEWTPRILPFGDFLWIMALVMPFGPILLEMQGFYQNPLRGSLWRSFVQILRAFLWLGLMIAGCVVFLRYDVPSRAVPLIFGGFGCLLLLARHHLYATWLARASRSPELRERVLLAGPLRDIATLEESLGAETQAGMTIAERIDIETQPLAELVEALHRHAVSRVIFAADHSNLRRVEEAIGACESEGVEVWLMANFIRTTIARPEFESLNGRPVLVFRTTPDVQWALLVKGLMDKLGALALIALSSPLLIGVAIAVRLTSPGPVIFRQQRSGRHGRPFTMYKFRSMYQDAEQRLAELQVHNQMSGPVFKMDRDPRITSVGQWIRKTSVDEFPQFFNVLRGDMSLVGPRPLPVYEVEKFEDSAHRRRLSVKPGLTCLWQISGRNEVTDFKEWVRLDLEYIDNWSLGLDIKILLKTIPVVLFGFGAK